jgi:hypothetical protein
VTSQKKDAAEALGAQEQFPIPDLEEAVYLSLFMHHARPDVSDDDEEYRRIGSKIANRLHRSPVAAVTVGKQLQRKKSISFWDTTANLTCSTRPWELFGGAISRLLLTSGDALHTAAFSQRI